MLPVARTIAVVSAMAGCSLAKSGDSENASAPGEATNLTVIHTADAEFVGGSGLAIYAPVGSILYQLTVNGRSSSGERWSAVTHVEEQTLFAGRGSAGIEARPAALGVAELHRQTAAGDLVPASAGTFAFQLEKGHITGQVTAAVPDMMNATFEGALGVACYVPGTGVSEGGSVRSLDGGPAPVLTPDEKLENPLCQPVRGWAPSQ